MVTREDKRVRELIPGLIFKVIHFKLFLDLTRFRISQDGLEITNPVTRILLKTAQCKRFNFTHFYLTR